VDEIGRVKLLSLIGFSAFIRFRLIGFGFGREGPGYGFWGFSFGGGTHDASAFGIFNDYPLLGRYYRDGNHQKTCDEENR
jgi:hypothetical protein